MNDYIGPLYGKRAGQYHAVDFTAQDYHALKSLTEAQKKKLDEQANLINILRKDVLTLQAKIDELDQHHVQERVGTLERYHDAIVDAETVIELQINEMKKGGE